jgi:L-xylulokinase
MAEYLLGIDNGLTVTKVAIFNAEGREVQVASRKVAADYPHPGWTERSMDALWRNTAEAIQEALALSGIKPSEIVGIGNTAYGNGLFLLDKNARPLRPGILSMDTRAGDLMLEWNKADLHQRVWPITLQAYWPAQPPMLLRWFKENEPELYSQIGAVLLCKDFIRYCLTGELASDFTDMSCSSMMDTGNKSYSRELLEHFEISEIWDALPTLIQSSEVVGHVTPEAAALSGLLAGTPVVGGAIDVSACALGSGVIHPGQVCMIAGTWSINEVVTAEPLNDPSLFMTSIYLPGLCLTIESSATSSTNLEWFVTQFCAEERAEANARGISIYDVCSEKVANLPGDGSPIIFHPFLFGSNVQPTARAGFYGVAGWHTRAHLLRAVYEGVIFSHLSHIEKLLAAGVDIKGIRFTGGGARSSIWTQMFADALQLPIEVPEGTEIGARGAAIHAGIGVGMYADYAEAVASAVKIERCQEPVAGSEHYYRTRYEEYRRLLEAMQLPWDRLNRMTN